MTVQNVLPTKWAGPRALYFALLLALATLVAVGYVVFRGFVTTVAPDLTAYNLYALAVIAGVASFFSPCAFPLLPSYLSFYYLAGQSVISGRRAGRALALGGAAALGVMTFNLLLGALIGILGAGFASGLSVSGPSPNTFVRIFRVLLGVALAALGILQLTGWSYKPAFVDEFAYRLRPTREGATSKPAWQVFLYGLGYNAAGMGCTGPILAGLTVYALAQSGFASAFTAFGIFSLTMGTLMLLVSGLVAASQETLIRTLKASAPRIKMVASILLILVGAFHIIASVNITWFVRLLFP